MKYLLLTSLFCLSFITSLNAQCNLSVSFSDTTIGCGTPLVMNANGFAGGAPLLSTNFNGGSLGAGWLNNPSLVYTNPCGPSLDGTPTGWFGNTITRTLITNTFDISCGAQMCFELDFAGDDACGGCSDCEDPDGIDEGVFFQYSINNGATWVDIFYFEPNSANTGPYYQWANYCFTIPPAALTPATMFRWDQPNVSSQVNDHWGLDNIVLTGAGCSFWYDWSHIAGFPDNAAQTVSPGTTTTYYVTYTDGLTSCTDSVLVNVLPLEIDIVGDPNPIDCGSCADLSVNFLNGTDGSIVDDFDSGINPLVWSDIQSGTPTSICGGGATGDALYFDGTGSNRYAETIGIDATSCGNIDFCLYMGNTASGGNPCDNNETGEDVILEYSIDNGVTFSPIATYAQSLWDGANYQQCFSEVMPLAAQTASTIFRWRQVAFSAFIGSDNWSLDDVDISCTSPFITYSWTTGTVNSPSVATPSACPIADELYTVSVVNSANGCNATDTMTLFVNECSCFIDLFDGAVSAQSPTDVDVTGSFEYSFSPTTGTIEVEATNATGTYSQTFNLPFTNNQVYNYSITGIPNDGSTITMEIYFSDSLSCTETFDLYPPTSCSFEQFDGVIVPQSAGVLDVEGTYMHLFSPSTGTIEVVATNTTGSYSQTINPPFTDNTVEDFLIAGIQDDSSTVLLSIYFTDSLGCTGTFDLTSTVSVEVIEGQDNICVFAPNPVYDKSQLIFNNENQDKVTISILNDKGQLTFETTTTNESISVDANRFRKGTYFFSVKSDGPMGDCSGKFVVL